MRSVVAAPSQCGIVKFSTQGSVQKQLNDHQNVAKEFQAEEKTRSDRITTMTLDDAVDLVLFAFKNGKPGDILVQKAPAVTIKTLVDAIQDLLGLVNHPIKVIGTRHGEKLYEVLLSREEMVAAKEVENYYCIPPDLRDLNYEKFVEKGEIKISDSEDYNSHNTSRLDVEEMKKMLMKLSFMQAAKSGDYIPSEE